MKICLVHDWLIVRGGAEKVLEAIYEIFPGDIFTLVKDTKYFDNSILKNKDVKTSFIQNLPFSKKLYRFYFPLFPFAVEELDLRECDLIISSSFAVAKGVLTSHEQLHICYCHTPMRYIWDLYLDYSSTLKGFRKIFYSFVSHYMRIWDHVSSKRVDYFIANSNYVARRVKKIYNRKAKVIYPPVDTDKFILNRNKEDFYITVSRLVPYKKVDIIVKAFTKLRDKKLIVIGDGPELKKIKSLAKGYKNIEILGYQPTDVVKNLMGKSKAFIFAADEDFGISPVEAQACGTPVIAYKKGGVTETVIENKTGKFFKKQEVDSLIETIKSFEKNIDNFDPFTIRKHSEKYDTKIFKINFENFVLKKANEFFSQR